VSPVFIACTVGRMLTRFKLPNDFGLTTLNYDAALRYVK
jgi:hypothetical protein